MGTISNHEPVPFPGKTTPGGASINDTPQKGSAYQKDGGNQDKLPGQEEVTTTPRGNKVPEDPSQ